MPFCNHLRKKSREVAASLLGQFLSRHCFTLCITVEVEPRIVKQYKCCHCCSTAPPSLMTDTTRRTRVTSPWRQWKFNLELWSGTNAATVAVAKITEERWWRVEKSVFTSFFSWEYHKFAEEIQFWASYSTSNKLLLVARHILTTGLQKCL